MIYFLFFYLMQYHDFCYSRNDDLGSFLFFFFFSSRRRHTRCREVSWARRCVQETGYQRRVHGKKIIMNEEDDGFAELELDRKAAMEELVKAAKLQVPQVPDDKPKFTRRRGILIPKCQLEQTRKKFAEDLKSEH
eukprot:TRINITY_DN23188_c0_g1_i2.p1 TRINITY_DN23188_c0_g1~~TRINITY_DN23188_c0_g1_i2.p1  ORF type:complete len:135 (-),score=54.74 TRINITY_DN23188_c0_g1_i2:115-519(-)